MMMHISELDAVWVDKSKNMQPRPLVMEPVDTFDMAMVWWFVFSNYAFLTYKCIIADCRINVTHCEWDFEGPILQ